MEALYEAVHRSATELQALLTALDEAGDPVRRSVRLNLDLQLVGLQTLEREMAEGAPTRRVWSLGQASLPVLSSLLNAVAKQAPDLDRTRIERCRRSLGDLGDALTNHAEGR